MGDLRPLDTYESGKNLKISKFDYDRYPNFDRVFTISPHCAPLPKALFFLYPLLKNSRGGTDYTPSRGSWDTPLIFSREARKKILSPYY